jgi:anti-sigma B factor antagonist
VAESLLAIDVVADGKTVTLVLEGELDLATAPSLRSCVESLDHGWDLVVVDLAGLTFMDSTGVALIAHVYGRSTKPGHPGIELRDPQPPVLRVLEITGFGELVEVTPEPRRVMHS